MKRVAKLSALAIVASTAFAATASASPEVRDHRTEQPRHYRRRVGPKVMMPLRLDIGMTGADTKMGYMPGFELRAGIHWASLSPKPTKFDIGIGGFVAALPGEDNAAMPEQDNDVVYGGAYLEVGRTLSEGRYWRTWASGRGEYIGSSTFGDTQAGIGVAGRLTAELYASGVGIEPRGLFVGSYAIGVYAEAAGRGLGEDVSALQISAGLTFRTPLVFMP